jgi:nitrous oxide reductase accessory protein NosL
MKTIDRRKFLYALAAAPAAIPLLSKRAVAMECKAQHPFMPPQQQYQGQCPVCGMVRPMWARTWITFDAVENVSQVCSFHCLADWTRKSGRVPTNVMLTVYHQPDTAVAATEAVIVMGSAAAGTMSPVSKIVFADRPAAQAFARTCGGDIVDYDGALRAATASVTQENIKIRARRLKKGKIVEPDANDSCPVCAMVPMRYPYGKCQVRTRAGQTYHFCSTQCLFAFLGKPAQYADTPVEPLLIWVVDRSSGLWISARAAFFVIGSTRVLGPMGHEALPFNSLAEAQAFSAQNGGTPTVFDEVTIQKIVPDWSYGAGE